MVTIKEVTTSSAFSEFVKFPLRLYKDNPYFIPDLFSDEKALLSGKKNAALEHCDTKYFLAYRDGRVAGRIGGIVNHKANALWERKSVRFTRVDFIDDDEVVDALFGALCGWAKGEGCDEALGPLGFSDMDKEGLLVEGFDRLSSFVTIYNHPYYAAQLERIGFVKDADWVEYLIRIPENPVEKLDRIAKLVQRKFNLTKIEFKGRKEIKKNIKNIFRLLNEAYGDLFQFVPLTDMQVDECVDQFLPFVNERFTCMINNDRGEMVGFGVAVPSLSKAIQKSGGRLFPIGFARILRALRKNDTIELLLIAIRKDYQGLGVNALLMSHFYSSAMKMGVRFAESGPELEANEKVQALWKHYDAELHKRRRCFIKPI